MRRARHEPRSSRSLKQRSRLLRGGILLGALLTYLLATERIFAEPLGAEPGGLRRADSEASDTTSVDPTHPAGEEQAPGAVESADGLVARARARADDGDFDGAASLLRRALVREPDHAGARLLLARVLSYDRRYEASIAEYETLLEFEPWNSLARAGYARTLSWAGRHGEAIREFRRAVASDSTNLETRIGLARVLSWSGDLPAAEREYRRVLRADPDLGDAWVGLASLARWRGAATASDRFLARARRRGADPQLVEEEASAVRTALEPTSSVGWSTSKEREDVTAAPDFSIETTGPFAATGTTIARAVGLRARVARLLLFEEPSTDSLNYDLEASVAHGDIAVLRGYPLQVSAGIEVQRFEQRPSAVRYPLGEDDSFLGYNVRAWSYVGRFEPSVGLRRDFIAIKDTTAAGARFIDPGHQTRLDGSLAYAWSARGSVSGRYSTGDYSDGNRRWTVGGRVAYRARTRLPHLTLDYDLSGSDWDWRSSSYFTPLKSTRHAAGLSLAGFAERGSIDYGVRYQLARIGSSNFDEIWTHAWSGYLNAVAAHTIPIGLEVSATIDNNDYETWFVGVHGGVRW